MYSIGGGEGEGVEGEGDHEAPTSTPRKVGSKETREEKVNKRKDRIQKKQ